MSEKFQRVARKLFKSRKRKLFGVIIRFQILQSEKQKKSLEDVAEGFYDQSRDRKYGPLFPCLFQWKNYGTAEETNR